MRERKEPRTADCTGNDGKTALEDQRYGGTSWDEMRERGARAAHIRGAGSVNLTENMPRETSIVLGFAAPTCVHSRSSALWRTVDITYGKYGDDEGSSNHISREDVLHA